MHTSIYNNVSFLYNGDFSGDITIAKDNEVMEVSAEAILKLVAYNYVLSHKIRQLQQTDYKKILEEI